MKTRIIVLGIMMSLVTTCAMADYYGAVDVGKSTVPQFCDGLVAGNTSNNNATDYRLSVGYQVNPIFWPSGILSPIFGVEVSYVNDGTLHLTAPSAWEHANVTEWQVAATSTFPVGSVFSAFGKAGASVWRMNSSANFALSSSFSPSGYSLLWGLGAQYDINKTLGVRCFYDSHMIGNSTTLRYHMNTVNLGMVYKF